MPIRYVLIKLKAGVNRDDYERFIRTVDYPLAPSLKSVRNYRSQRIRPEDRDPQSFDWDYLERIEISDPEAHRRELDSSPGFAEFRRQEQNYVERHRAFWADILEPED